MTAGVRKSLLVAAIHVAIVASLGAKLLIDRATQPRVWARVAPYDPALPIRGRYVRLQIEGTLAGAPSPNDQAVTLSDQKGALVFEPSTRPTGLTIFYRLRPNGTTVEVLNQPIAFFIPEHQPDPSIRPAGEELWTEVTLPRRGRPRPIRLGIKKNGQLTPLK